MEFKTIINEEIDSAGKYRVWVDVSDGESVMLKFDKYSPTEIIQAETIKWIENRQKLVSEKQKIESEERQGRHFELPLRKKRGVPEE